MAHFQTVSPQRHSLVVQIKSDEVVVRRMKRWFKEKFKGCFQTLKTLDQSPCEMASTVESSVFESYTAK